MQRDAVVERCRREAWAQRAAEKLHRDLAAASAGRPFGYPQGELPLGAEQRRSGAARAERSAAPRRGVGSVGRESRA